MVEIDYYLKYLKYKQKYLKQKNLQIGGKNINVTIIINNQKNIYKNQILESTKKISDAINEWLISNKITFTNFSVYRKIVYINDEIKKNDLEKIQEINNTFDYYTFSDKGEELLIETQQ